MKHGEIHKRLSPAEQFAALNRVSTAVMSELDEAHLLHLITETACELTGAAFAVFSLRPIDDEGKPLVPSEGNLFHLAAVVGVTPEQEALLRGMPLGGEGLLTPIFRYGVTVRVPDALSFLRKPGRSQTTESRYTPTEARGAARQAAFDYAHGQHKEDLRSFGVPRGHPVVRSFLGVPLLDRSGEVRGGLLLGHKEPGQFTHEDEALLVGLATQAAVALENARLYRLAQRRVQELNAIFESIADGVTLLDNQGNILRENDAARRLREQLKDTPLERFPISRILAGEVLTPANAIDMEFRVPGGHTLHLSITGGPLHDADGQIVGAVAISRDMAERRRLEETERRMYAEVETRHALLQLILDKLPSSVYLVRGQDARLVLANRAATTVWGALWPQDQPMSEFLTENEIRIFGTDGHPLEPSQLATMRALQYGDTVQQHQETIRHPDGTTLPVLVNAVPVDLRALNVLPSQMAWSPYEGREPAALVVHQDVSALKEAERLKDEFLSMAAHELRNPLAVLRGFAQMLITQTTRGKGRALADWQMEALIEIEQATLRLNNLTEDLVDVTRLQAGRLTLHHEPTDLVALARRLVRRFQTTTKQHVLSLHTILPHLVVQVDPGRMEQVLDNLISNAIKYSPQGGPIQVSIHKEVEANMVLLSVRDLGIGIPAYQQSHIFGRFVRADNAQASGIGGTGLGLYLCRELVERHGGHLWFGSAEGEGSTFFITLPVASESVPSR